jgi:Predicted pPIWI-associating nuclease
MTDSLEALDEIAALVSTLETKAAETRSKTLSSQTIQPIARAIAKNYFEFVRPELDIVKSRAGLVDEIDFVIQTLLQLSTTSREKHAYLGQVNELRPYLLEATVDLMKSRGSRLILSAVERSILDTLRALLPATAASYEQALRDIAQGARSSWRGTALELREVLRDVIDHLAPDDKVIRAHGFQPERGQQRPTQKQKVRYVLRARRTASAARTVAEASLATVDEAVATLARSAYQSGSASGHTAASSKEIRNLKRYIDALLAELLEIS